MGWKAPVSQPQTGVVVGQPQVSAVVQSRVGQVHVTAVVSPPATCPRSLVDVRARRVSVESVSFLPRLFLHGSILCSRWFSLRCAHHNAARPHLGDLERV